MSSHCWYLYLRDWSNTDQSAFLPVEEVERNTLQSTRIETRDQVGYTLPLDRHIRRDDIVANAECDRNDIEFPSVKESRKGRTELSDIDDDLHNAKDCQFRQYCESWRQ